MNPFESQGSNFGDPGVEQFIGERDISPEHFGLIKELLKIPKEVLIMSFHNFFNLYRENSAEELRISMEHTEEGQLKECYRSFLEIVTSYDWTTAYSLERLLEKIN